MHPKSLGIFANICLCLHFTGFRDIGVTHERLLNASFAVFMSLMSDEDSRSNLILLKHRKSSGIFVNISLWSRSIEDFLSLE